MRISSTKKMWNWSHRNSSTKRIRLLSIQMLNKIHSEHQSRSHYEHDLCMKFTLKSKISKLDQSKSNTNKTDFSLIKVLKCPKQTNITLSKKVLQLNQIWQFPAKRSNLLYIRSNFSNDFLNKNLHFFNSFSLSDSIQLIFVYFVRTRITYLPCDGDEKVYNRAFLFTHTARNKTQTEENRKSRKKRERSA